MYIVDEFSPYEDPEEEAAKRRAAAVSRPAVASPAPDVQNPAPPPTVSADTVAPNPNPDSSPTPTGAADQSLLKVRPGVTLNADSTLAQPDAAASAPSATSAATPAAPAAPSNWSQTVQNANDAQSQLGQQSVSSLQDFQRRYKDLQARKDRLLQSRQNAAQPINSRDSSGNLLSDYKPSFTQRLLRGVSAIRRGGVLAAAQPQDVGVAGYGDPNARYGRDLSMQAARVGGLDSAIAATDKDEKDAFEQAKGTGTYLKDVAGVYKDINSAATAQQGAETATAKLPIDQQNAYNVSPAGMAERASQVSAAQWKARNQVADQMKLKGNTRTLFLANGRLPDPRQATEGEIKVAQATAAWHRDNPGKQPSLSDINQINQAAGGRSAGGGSGAGVAGNLDAVPESLRATVQAIGEGRQLPNTRSKDGLAVQNYVNQVYPGYDQSRAQSYVQARTKFTSGKQGDQIASMRRALHHLDALESSFSSMGNDRFAFDNWVKNTAASAVGSKTGAKFDGQVAPVVTEVTKAFKGGTPGEKEAEAQLAKFSKNMSPDRFHEAVTGLRELLHGQIQAARDEYNASRPPGMPDDLFDLPNLKGVEGAAGVPEASPAGGDNAFDFSKYAVAQ